MKKVLFTVAAIACALAITASAAEGKKKTPLTDEQKSLQKQMLEKYDANKDGKLDKEEKAKMSKEDKQKMKDAGLAGQKKGEKKDAK
jgi:hypothetical protein